MNSQIEITGTAGDVLSGIDSIELQIKKATGANKYWAGASAGWVASSSYTLAVSLTPDTTWWKYTDFSAAFWESNQGYTVNTRAMDNVGNRQGDLQVFPKFLCEFPYLKYLDFWTNQIKEIPEEIEMLKKLRFLSLGFNEIEIVPHSMTQLKKLKRLDLRGNYISSYPDELNTIKHFCIKWQNEDRGY